MNTDVEVGFKRVLAQARRLHLLGLISSTIVCAALLIWGLLFATRGHEQLHEFMEERMARVKGRILPMLDSARAMARLVTLQQEVVGTAPGKSAAQEVMFAVRLRREGTRFRVLNGSPRPEFGLVPGAMVDVTLSRGEEIPTTLWPRSQPAAVLYCIDSGAPEIACSALSLVAVLDSVRGNGVLLAGLRLADASGRTIAQDTEWSAGLHQIAPGTLPLMIGGEPLTLIGQAGEMTWAAFRIEEGYWLAAIAGLLLSGSWILLFSRYRHFHRQQALVQEVESTRKSDEDLMRATLRGLCDSTGQLVWLLRDDEQVELLGAWRKQMGIEKSHVPLRIILKHARDGETVVTTLLAALRARSPWSRLVVVDVDGEPVTFQVNATPLLDAGGRFVALLGVSSNITGALRDQKQVRNQFARCQECALMAGWRSRPGATAPVMGASL